MQSPVGVTLRDGGTGFVAPSTPTFQNTSNRPQANANANPLTAEIGLRAISSSSLTLSNSSPKSNPFNDAFVSLNAVMNSKKRENKAIDPAAKEIIRKIDLQTKNAFSLFLKGLLPHGVFLGRYALIHEIQFQYEQEFQKFCFWNQAYVNENPKALFYTLCAAKYVFCQIGCYSESANPEINELQGVEKCEWSKLNRMVKKWLVQGVSLNTEILNEIRSESGVRPAIMSKRLEPLHNMLNIIKFLNILIDSEQDTALLSKRLETLVGWELSPQDFKKLPAVVSSNFTHVLTDLKELNIKTALDHFKFTRESHGPLLITCSELQKDLEGLSSNFKVLTDKKTFAYSEIFEFYLHYQKFNEKFMSIINLKFDLESGLSLDYQHSKKSTHSDLVKLFSGILGTTVTISRLNSTMLLLTRVKLLEEPKFNYQNVDNLISVLTDFEKLVYAIGDIEYFTSQAQSTEEKMRALFSENAGSELIQAVHQFVQSDFKLHLKRMVVKWQDGNLIQDTVNRLKALKEMQRPDPRFLNDLLNSIEFSIIDDVSKTSQALTSGYQKLINEYFVIPASFIETPQGKQLDMAISDLCDVYIYGLCCLTAPSITLEKFFKEYTLLAERQEENLSPSSPINNSARQTKAGKKVRRKKTLEEKSTALEVPKNIAKSVAQEENVQTRNAKVDSPPGPVAIKVEDVPAPATNAVESKGVILEPPVDSSLDPVVSKDEETLAAKSVLDKSSLKAKTIISPQIETPSEPLLPEELEDFFAHSGKSLKLRNFLPLMQKYGWSHARNGKHMVFTNSSDKSLGHIAVPNHGDLSLGLALKLKKLILERYQSADR